MKYALAICLIAIQSIGQEIKLWGQAPDSSWLKSYNCWFDETYGSAERNTFDIICPKSPEPVPLVIFIHGGGFVSGNKQHAYQYRKGDIEYFLDNNIAFATINYSYRLPDDSLGVQRCLSDAAQALQYIRHQDTRYTIDKDRVACYGYSAGAGISLYLAMHDDLAIPDDTGVSGESTRLRGAGAMETQSTYDMFRWKRIIPGMRLITLLKRKMIYNAIASFYGYPSYKSFKPQRRETCKNLDILEMLSPNDPPLYAINLIQGRLPLNDNVIQHHRKHAIQLARHARRHDINTTCYVRNRKIKSEDDVEYSIREFLMLQLR